MTENTEVPSPPAQVGVLMVTHGVFGAALLEAAQMILGPQQGIAAVSVHVSKGVEEIVVALKSGVSSLDTGLGVILLTDLFGGTPTTLSLSLLKGGSLEVVSGVNLPMLLKVLQCRQMKLPELASQAKSAGQDGIKVPGEMLRKKPAGS